MKFVMLGLWVFFISAAFGWLTPNQSELDTQRAQYILQNKERILRVWAPPPEEHGLMIVPPPEAKMAVDHLDRSVDIFWHGTRPVRLSLSASLPPGLQGIVVDFPRELELEPGAQRRVTLRIKLKTVDQSVDTIDIHLSGRVTYAKL